MPLRQTYCSHSESQSHSKHLHTESSSSNSQPTLPSIPSHNRHQLIATLKGHATYPSSIAIAGKFLYTGSSDREIRLYKRNSLTSEFEYESLTDNTVAAGTGAVKSLVVLSNKIFSAHQDHKIRVWKIEAGHQKFLRLATLPTLSDRALKLLTPKNHVQIRRHKKCTWVHHVDTVSALALSSDESLLYSVSWDRTIKIWQTTDFKCLESVRNAHDDAINAVALADDGHVYTGSADKTIRVWRKNPGETKHTLVSTLEKHNSGVNALALSTDGLVLYSGSCDRSILAWEKEDDSGDMMVVGVLRGHAKPILCLAVVSNIVFSGSADATVRVWTGAGGCYSCLAVLEGHRGPVKCLTAESDRLNPSDGTTYLLYTGSLDCDIKVWQISAPSL
ncbi:[Myosin heavy-chain] kinase [Bertholletia excelsa]